MDIFDEKKNKSDIYFLMVTSALHAQRHSGQAWSYNISTGYENAD